MQLKAICLEGGRILAVYYDDMKNAIYNTAVYFRNAYLDAWIKDDFAKQATKSMDKAEVIDPV